MLSEECYKLSVEVTILNLEAKEEGKESEKEAR